MNRAITRTCTAIDLIGKHVDLHLHMTRMTGLTAPPGVWAHTACEACRRMKHAPLDNQHLMVTSVVVAGCNYS